MIGIFYSHQAASIIVVGGDANNSRNSNLPLIMALGGVAFQTRKDSLNNNISNQAFNEMMNNKFDEVNNKFDKVIEVFERKQDALHAVVSIKEYRKKEKQYDDAKKASGMSQ